MDLIGNFIRRFSGRKGLPGKIAGFLAARRDRAFFRRIFAILDIQPGDAVVEMGCGPVMAMDSLLKYCKKVFVAGVDASGDRVEEAWRKNRRAIKQGRAMLVRTEIAAGLPAFATPFAKAVAVNPSFGGRPVETLKAVRAAMAPGGKIVLAVLPWGEDITPAEAGRTGKELRGHLAAAGFDAVRLQEIATQTATAVCVAGINPNPAAKSDRRPR